MLGKFKPQISQISADVSEVWKNLYRRRACRPARQPAKNLLCLRRFKTIMK